MWSNWRRLHWLLSEENIIAIVVPFLLSSTAVGSAIGLAGSIAGAIGGALGVSAGLVSTITSVAFQVTGINDKINKAASKVFGEDLVGIANIAGMAYGAINGGFDLGGAADAGGAASAIDASSAGAVNGMDAASDAFSAANSASGGGLISDGMGGVYNPPGTAGNVIDSLAKNGLSGANEYTPDGGMNSVEMNAVAPDQTAGTNLIEPSQPLGIDSKALEQTTKSAEVASTSAAAPRAAGLDAAGGKAAAGQALKAGEATQSATAPPALQKAAATPTLGAKSGSFFDKLMNNDKALGAVIQGVGGGISAAANSKAEKDKLEWMKQRYTATPNVRVLQ